MFMSIIVIAHEMISNFSNTMTTLIIVFFHQFRLMVKLASALVLYNWL
jgi:hypothetical protein